MTAVKVWEEQYAEPARWEGSLWRKGVDPVHAALSHAHDVWSETDEPPPEFKIAIRVRDEEGRLYKFTVAVRDDGVSQTKFDASAPEIEEPDEDTRQEYMVERVEQDASEHGRDDPEW